MDYLKCDQYHSTKKYTRHSNLQAIPREVGPDIHLLMILLTNFESFVHSAMARNMSSVADAHRQSKKAKWSKRMSQMRTKRPHNFVFIG